MIVKHRFITIPCENTEILILGTFNPDVPANKANYYYSRPQNHFWKLIPIALGTNLDLRKATKDEKIRFCEQFNIDFLDLISEIEVNPGEESNYSDDFIDSKIKSWTPVEEFLLRMPKLKCIYFTRKTFSGIKNIRLRLKSIQEFCTQRNIELTFLPTPARIYTPVKQNYWNSAFLSFRKSSFQ